MTAILNLAFALLAGLLMTRIFSRWHLPDVTAFLVTGVLIGPFVLGRLGIPGLGFSSYDQVEALSMISDVAMGFIAFSIGNEFRLSQLKKTGKQAMVIGVLQALAALAFVDIALVAFHFMRPDVLSVPAAITLGAIATATAPATMPCGICRTCRMIADGVHPDVMVAKANSNGNYIVDDSIRPIVAEAPVAPNEARMKVYIIPDLDLSVNTVIQVQNILLKVIEEPPEHTAIILTARSKEIFLPTIISRVLSLGMTSVTEAESMACLQEKYPAVAPALISEAVSAGRGNIGRCVEYLEHSQFFDSVKLARGLCDAMCGGNEYDVLKTLFAADGKKTLLREGLSLFQEILRDSAAFRLGGESEKSVSCAKEGAKTLSRSLSSDQAVRLYDIVSDYIGRIDANCNISLTINSLAGQIYSVTGK